MALAGVEGTIGGDAADLLIRRDLVEKFGQHGRVADTAGFELRSPDFECFLISSSIDLAPDKAFGATVLARVPFPSTSTLMPVLSTSRRIGAPDPR
jgi:hypothetical protein